MATDKNGSAAAVAGVDVAAEANRVAKELDALAKKPSTKDGSFMRFYGRARKGGKVTLPVEYATDKGTITVQLPLPAALSHDAAIAESKENGYSYTLPTKGTLIGNGVAKDATGKMKGDIAAEALDDLNTSAK